MNLTALINRLHPHAKTSLEQAVGYALSLTHFQVELEHWFVKLLEDDQPFQLLLQELDIDAGEFKQLLHQQLERFKTGNGSPPAISQELVQLIQDTWLTLSVEDGGVSITSIDLLLGLQTNAALSLKWQKILEPFKNVTPDQLKSAIQTVHQQHDVSNDKTSDASTEYLQQVTIDLTELARDGKIDPVRARQKEIRQVVDVLCRRRQNNPILVGEAGVGKTAIVEGLALEIVAGNVPDHLKPAKLLSLDLGLLQAGAGVKGEFENRLKKIIAEIKTSEDPILLFIDEAHTLVGAGGQSGQNDAANLLKPALARGELRTIGATTWIEYKKYIEKDPALSRRFQLVKVEEPNEADAIAMLRGVIEKLSNHHGVHIQDEAVNSAVKLSHRYIPDRQLPDKAVSLLDTACARVALSQKTLPDDIQVKQQSLQQIRDEIELLEQDETMQIDQTDRLADLAERFNRLTEDLSDEQQHFSEENEMVQAYFELRNSLATTEDHDAKEAIKQDLIGLREKITLFQSEHPMIHMSVDQQAVAEVVASWTGIPVGRMMADEISSILDLSSVLQKRVIGQNHAIDKIANCLITSRAKLTDPRKPIGVFLMAGPSGVGKTETALALAEQVYGNENNVTVINMSEFKEEHKVSLLIGSPPGYVGYGEGGVLTEAVRRRPYSVILLDEIEKAHPGVQDIFYQVFDKGMLRDGEGRDIDFKNTLIVMTCNVGSHAIERLCQAEETLPDEAMLFETIKPDLLRVFKPAFLGRVTVLPYLSLTADTLRSVIIHSLDRIKQRIDDQYQASFNYSETVVDEILDRCQATSIGARAIEAIINEEMLPEMANQFLSNMLDGKSIHAVSLDLTDSGEWHYLIDAMEDTVS